jgi:hypothetical protein
MQVQRRRFLTTLGTVASCWAVAETLALAQKKKNSPFPDPPEPAETPSQAEINAAKHDSQSSKRAQLAQNEKEFRAEVDRLFQLTSQLKQEVDGTATMEVFSVQMYKRTEEIEKLAKQLKAKAKG